MAVNGRDMIQAAGSMGGKVCVVTGASSGIGYETARGLAQMGATVALVCRNRERGENARLAIRQSAVDAMVDLFLADLGSQRDIRRVAQELLSRYPRIDVLVNNAGLVAMRRSTTVDGIETVFAVNHLAYFLLTRLLLARLSESGRARIVNVASGAHKQGQLDFEDLQSERAYRVMRVYGLSKLCNILFTRELARRLAGTGVTANCLNPGAVATRLGQNNGWWAVLLMKALRLLFRSTVRGAETPIYLASSLEVEGVSGKYFVDCREVDPSPAAQDDDAAKRLWQVSAAMTG